jgi:hypothetical protein
MLEKYSDSLTAMTATGIMATTTIPESPVSAIVLTLLTGVIAPLIRFAIMEKINRKRKLNKNVQNRQKTYFN